MYRQSSHYYSVHSYVLAVTLESCYSGSRHFCMVPQENSGDWDDTVILLSVQSSTRGPEDCTAACIMHNNWIRTSNELYPTQCLKISSIIF